MVFVKVIRQVRPWLVTRVVVGALRGVALGGLGLIVTCVSAGCLYVPGQVAGSVVVEVEITRIALLTVCGGVGSLAWATMATARRLVHVVSAGVGEERGSLGGGEQSLGSGTLGHPAGELDATAGAEVDELLATAGTLVELGGQQTFSLLDLASTLGC
jgi:hypothetical protein